MPHADEAVGGLRRQHQMVDADAVVLLPRPGLIVPEGVEPRLVRGRADGVGEAEVRPGRGSGRGSAAGRARRRSIARCRGRPRAVGNDVVVAGQHERLLKLQALAGVGDQPVEPGELVAILVGVRRVAVGQVERGEAQRAAAGSTPPPPGSGPGRRPRRPAAGRDLVERQLRQDGDAVEGLLAVDGDVVAGVLERARAGRRRRRT